MQFFFFAFPFQPQNKVKQKIRSKNIIKKSWKRKSNYQMKKTKFRANENAASFKCIIYVSEILFVRNYCKETLTSLPLYGFFSGQFWGLSFFSVMTNSIIVIDKHFDSVIVIATTAKTGEKVKCSLLKVTASVRLVSLTQCFTLLMNNLIL